MIDQQRLHKELIVAYAVDGMLLSKELDWYKEHQPDSRKALQLSISLRNCELYLQELCGEKNA